MPSKITYTPAFLREVKKLAKKHRSLKQDLASLEQELLENPRSGTLISENIYKVRLAIKSKNKGKSGGGRVITFILERLTRPDVQNVVLLSVYDKADQPAISKEYLIDSAKRFLKAQEEE